MSTLSSINKNCRSIEVCKQTLFTNYQVMLSITGGGGCVANDERIFDDYENYRKNIKGRSDEEAISIMRELNTRIMRIIADESARRLKIQIDGGDVGYPY